MTHSLRLYVKNWCPWCIKARKYLDDNGYRYDTVDVEANREAYDEMIKISGQRLTPTLIVGGKVLPDFGPEELAVFLTENNLKP